jgi:hypothetical protein
MRDAASEAATERQSNARCAWGLLLPGNSGQAASEGLYRTNDPVQTFHGNLISPGLPQFSN